VSAGILSPLPNLIKAQDGSKKQLRYETYYIIPLQIATITGGKAMLRLMLGLSAAALAASPAMAANYSAKLAQPTSDRFIARDITWNCGPAACQGATQESRPTVLCQSLAKRAGRVDSFTVDGRAFESAELERCNAFAKGTNSALAAK
jgi:hypothetical protein